MNNLQHGYVLLQDAANTFKISVPRVAGWTLRQVKLFKISMRSLGGELQKREGRKMEKKWLKIKEEDYLWINVEATQDILIWNWNVYVCKAWCTFNLNNVKKCFWNIAGRSSLANFVCCFVETTFFQLDIIYPSLTLLQISCSLKKSGLMTALKIWMLF